MLLAAPVADVLEHGKPVPAADALEGKAVFAADVLDEPGEAGVSAPAGPGPQSEGCGGDWGSALAGEEWDVLLGELVDLQRAVSALARRERRPSVCCCSESCTCGYG